jgi:hypothetical protein
LSTDSYAGSTRLHSEINHSNNKEEASSMTTRSPIEPDESFRKRLLQAVKSGANLEVDGIHIYSPTHKKPYWRVFCSFRREKFEITCGKTPATANAGFLEARAWLQSRQHASLGLPENANKLVAEVLENYIANGGGNYAWSLSTIKERKGNFKLLIARSRKLGIKCSELNVEHIRSFVNEYAGTAQRGQFTIDQTRTFLEWGYATGHFTSEQTLMVKKIRWSAPAGSSYQTRPTRRQQSLQLA